MAISGSIRAGQIASDTAFVPLLQAMRVAGGKDFIRPRPNAQWLTLRWPMEILPRDGQPYYPNRHPSSYGTEFFERVGLSRGGQFAQGFGAVDPKYIAATLWTYQHFVEPAEPDLGGPLKKQFAGVEDWMEPGEKSFDAVLYPHRAVLALVNWPIGIVPQNPAEVFPKAMRDSIREYFVFRNRWQDADDIIVTALLGARSERGQPEPITVWGLGMRVEFPIALPKAKVGEFIAEADGSGTFTVPLGKGTAYSVLVDLSGKSGAPLVIVMAGGTSIKKPMSKQGRAGVSVMANAYAAERTVYSVLTLQQGDAPSIKVQGDSLLVGDRRISFVEGKLRFEKTEK